MTGTIITVTNTNDSGAGSLRQAIIDAGTTDNVVINFAEDLKGETITLQSQLLIDSGQDITISGDIDGDGAYDITISGDANGSGYADFGDVRLLKVETGAEADLSYLALIEGYAYNSNNSNDNNTNEFAASIANYGDLTIANSLIADNFSRAASYSNTFKNRAATIYTAVKSLSDPRSSLTVTDTLFENNTAEGGFADYISAGGDGSLLAPPEAAAGIFRIYSDLTITRTGFGGDAQGGATVGAQNGSQAVVGVRSYGAGDTVGQDGLIQIGIQSGSTATPGAPQGTGSAASGTLGVLGNVTAGQTLVVGESGTSGADALTGGGEGTAKLILGFGGDDQITLGSESDTVFAGDGNDGIDVGNAAASNNNAVRVYGQGGDDVIRVNDAQGTHVFSGGKGVDRLSFFSAGDASTLDQVL